jgi:4-hydroxybenzoate polyprenyltransferase
MILGWEPHRSNRPPNWLMSTVAAIRLIHVFPSVTVVAASVLLMFVASRGNPPLGLLLRGAAVVAASQVAVGALNDYVDRHDDARTQPEKPLTSGLVSTRTALAMVAGGIVVCCGVSFTFGPVAFCISTLGLISGLAYDLRLKRTPFSPVTYMVSFLSLFTWIWYITGAITRSIVLVYPLGACLLLAAHLANALPDASTDAMLGQRGLVVLLGPRRALNIMLLISAGAAACTMIFCFIEGVTVGIILSLVSVILVGFAVRVARRSELDRPALQLIFKYIAPTIALTAAAFLLAFEAAT